MFFAPQGTVVEETPVPVRTEAITGDALYPQIVVTVRRFRNDDQIRVTPQIVVTLQGL